MTDMTVANEIAKQIGGGALYMIGAKNLLGSDDSLTFKIMRNASKVTHIRVTLDRGTDTYRVEFLKINNRMNAKNPVSTLADSSGIYCDMLRREISENTGLALSL